MIDHESLREVFAESVAEALRVMAGVEAIPAPALGLKDWDIVATVRLTGGANGRLILAFPSATAQSIAARVLDQTNATPALIRDCMGEVANVVAGQAKARLFGAPAHFNLSVPSVTDHVVALLGDALAIDFMSDAGPFSLRLELSSPAPTDGQS